MNPYVSVADEQEIEVEDEATGATEAVLEIDELGSLVIDLRAAFDHPAAPEVASHHLEAMLAALDDSDPPAPARE
jgi:hypothetical protein